MSATKTIESIQSHAKLIGDGKHESVKPGMEFRLTNAASIGDAVWQGDLCLEVVNKVPSAYAKAKKPTVQLVPGNTQGSRHCLDSLAGVDLYYSANWPASAESDFLGPCFKAKQEVTVLHPVHGAVVIPAGMVILCSYQREWDAELRQQRRNQD
jgi:hypothetical protein